MNNSIYGNYNTDSSKNTSCCCNDSSNDSCNSSCNSSCNYSCNCSCNSINSNIKAIENNLCNMKIALAETKVNLLILAQVECSKGNLCSTEKTLLLNIEQELKKLNDYINDNKEHLECLSYLNKLS